MNAPSSTYDLFFLVGAICALWVTAFLCWALYELARLVRQANDVVEDTRNKMERFERAVTAIGEKLGVSAQYVGLLAEGGKQLFKIMQARKQEPKKSGKKKRGEDEDDE